MPVLSDWEAGLLRDIKKKVDQIYDETLLIKSNHAKNGELTINVRNKMVWWNKQEDAALYRLKLFVKDNEIEDIEIQRTKCYHTFTDLIGTGYKIVLEVEDRNGKILNSVEINF